MSARSFRRSGLILLMALLVSGCAGPALEDYSDTRPQLVPDEFFRGELSARGVVKDYSGEVIRTFDADIQATWDEDGVGTLDVRMDDWMYLITPNTLINQTTMSKWGIDVGEVVLVIQKHERSEPSAGN
ncbi:MAG: DUF3833 family protein [Alteromonadaceae bacterium]|nr:DUF3833 family protein [Alteromonadaceae bacterium]